MKLELGKTYLTEKGIRVKVIYISKFKFNLFPVFGMILENEEIKNWDEDGMCASRENEYKIISEYKEPEYVPFDESDNPEDIMKEIIKRGGYLKWKNGYRCVIPSIVNKSFVVAANYNIEYSDLLKDATFADNTPFGKLK